MLPWKSIITIDTNLKRAVYIQIADSIIEEILSGRLSVGQKMPGTRTLSDILGLNRKTVSLAYDELVAQGWINIIPSKGTFVGKSLPIADKRPLGQLSTEPKGSFIETINHSGFSFRPEPNLLEQRIDDGSPDYRMAPIESLLKAARFHSKGRLGKHILLNRDPLGQSDLRDILISYLATTRAIHGTADQLLITRGSQMALFLIFQLLLEKNDKVIVSEINYQSANQAITYHGGDLIKVGLDNDGINVDQIREICTRQKIRAVYITPHHHFPTTVTMSVDRRIQLLELSRKHNFAIIEDDYDYDYHYQGSPILPLASLDKVGNIIYIGSFGKMLAPSIRIGYMFAHGRIIQECSFLRRIMDKVGDPLMERALGQLIEDNELQRYMKKSVNAYRVRRDLLADILTKNLSEYIEFSKPDGGMAIWTQWNKGIHLKDVITLCRTNNLSLDVDRDLSLNACRLGFASMNEQEIKANTDTLIQVVKENYS